MAAFIEIEKMDTVLPLVSRDGSCPIARGGGGLFTTTRSGSRKMARSFDEDSPTDDTRVFICCISFGFNAMAASDASMVSLEDFLSELDHKAPEKRHELGTSKPARQCRGGLGLQIFLGWPPTNRTGHSGSAHEESRPPAKTMSVVKPLEGEELAAACQALEDKCKDGLRTSTIE